MNKNKVLSRFFLSLICLVFGLGLHHSAWADTKAQFNFVFGGVIPGYYIAAYAAPGAISGVLTFDSAGTLTAVSDLAISTVPGPYTVTSVSGVIKNYSFAFKVNIPGSPVTVYYNFYDNFSTPYIYSYHRPENSPEFIGASFLKLATPGANFVR